MKPQYFAALLTATVAIASCNDTTPKSEPAIHAHTAGDGHSTTPEKEVASMAGIMDRMMSDMHAMKPTGNPDKDFAIMMIAHHQGAIDMAKLELAQGKDPEIRKMAESIAAAQGQEIAAMKKLEATLPPGDSTVDHMNDPLMQSMQVAMPHNDRDGATGSMDKDFVQAMIPHHEGAVAMAKVQLERGRNAELKRMAQQMIDDQTREIAQFRQWLAAYP